jgi:hypothetical protein
MRSASRTELKFKNLKGRENSVDRRKWMDNISKYNQQDATLHNSLFPQNALHVSGGTCAHHQELKNCIYSIGYLSNLYCCLPLSWKSWQRQAAVKV